MLCVGSCLKPKPFEAGKWPMWGRAVWKAVSTAATWLGLSMQGPKELQASAKPRTPNLCSSKGPQADAQPGYWQTSTGLSSHTTEGKVVICPQRGDAGLKQASSMLRVSQLASTLA